MSIKIRVVWVALIILLSCGPTARAQAGRTVGAQTGRARADPPPRDFGGWGAECAQAPFSVVRYLVHALDRYPKAKAVRVGWFCSADNFDCVYAPRRAALTVHYQDAATGGRSVSRLYHVTRPVLLAASREPLFSDDRGLSCEDSFGFLLRYGAKRRS